MTSDSNALNAFIAVSRYSSFTVVWCALSRADIPCLWPRPETLETMREISEVQPRFAERNSVKPGITQVFFANLSLITICGDAIIRSCVHHEERSCVRCEADCADRVASVAKQGNLTGVVGVTGLFLVASVALRRVVHNSTGVSDIMPQLGSMSMYLFR